MKINQLSKREQQVVELVLQGLTDPQIAKELIVSVYTVRAHLTNIYNKLGCDRGKVGIFVHKIKELTNESK